MLIFKVAGLKIQPNRNPAKQFSLLFCCFLVRKERKKWRTGQILSQFVVVYGRRRIGKTFLVREAFDYKFTFQHAGIANAPKSVQIHVIG